MPFTEHPLDVQRSACFGVKLTYFVVEFPDEGSTAVIPSTWVHEVEDGIGKCWWPKFSQQKLNKAVETGESPDPSTYTLYSMRILNKKTLSDYKKARQVLAVSTLRSDVDITSEENTIRKRSAPTRLCEDDSDSSDIESLPSTSKRPAVGTHYSISTSPSPSQGSSHSFLRDIPAFPPAQSSQPTLPKGLSSLPSGVSRMEVKMLSLLEGIIQEQRSQRRLLETILRKQTTEETVPEPSLPDGVQMPLVTVEELEDFDRKLSDADSKASVIQYLSLIGGETVKEVVRRVLCHVMDQNLVLQYTWQGTPQKKAFQALLLCGVLKKVVRRIKATSQETDKSIDFAVREFFRTAADRNGGRLKRKLAANSRNGDENQNTA